MTALSETALIQPNRWVALRWIVSTVLGKTHAKEDKTKTVEPTEHFLDMLPGAFLLPVETHQTVVTQKPLPSSRETVQS